MTTQTVKSSLEIRNSSDAEKLQTKEESTKSLSDLVEAIRLTFDRQNEDFARLRTEALYYAVGQFADSPEEGMALLSETPDDGVDGVTYEEIICNAIFDRSGQSAYSEMNPEVPFDDCLVEYHKLSEIDQINIILDAKVKQQEEEKMADTLSSARDKILDLAERILGPEVRKELEEESEARLKAHNESS